MVMRTWRILLIALQLVLLIPSFGMSQEMNECTTAIIDSIVDAKVQQVLADNIEQSVLKLYNAIGELTKKDYKVQIELIKEKRSKMFL